MTYSNSKYDNVQNESTKRVDEDSVRAMYESVPYPGPSHTYKKCFDWFLQPIKEDLDRCGNLRFLDAGCGTGVNIIAAHMLYPE
ncbi:MAG: hypothetical protein KKB70_02875 [Proteobacteria bacterium]|nr:hypothetical protein [Pseudomonadota bacterium]